LYELKKDKQLSRIPVLIVTAHAQDDLGKGDLEDIMENLVMSGPGVYLEKPVNPLTYVRAIQRALGIEETEELEDKISLKEQLQQSMQAASPEALRKALETLKATNKG
jgi:CheY-like chemotaxis protein